MQRLILNDVTAITDIGVEELKSKRRRDQLAFAFGCTDASARLRYVAADAVAVLLTKDLARTHGAKLAARLVIMFGDVMLRAIADAEADTRTDVMISVADVGRESDDRRGHVACYGRHGASEAMTGDVAPDRRHIGAELARPADAVSLDVVGYTIERVVTVNVSRAIRAVRAGAERLGIDLSGSFMFAPDPVELDDVLRPYAELPSGVVESNAYRQRVAASRRAGAQARALAMGGGRVAAASRKQSGQGQRPISGESAVHAG